MGERGQAVGVAGVVGFQLAQRQRQHVTRDAWTVNLAERAGEVVRLVEHHHLVLRVALARRTHVQVQPQRLATLLVENQVVRQQHQLQVRHGPSRRVVWAPAHAATRPQQVLDRQVLQLRVKSQQRTHKQLAAHGRFLLLRVERTARLAAAPTALQEQTRVADLRVGGQLANAAAHARQAHSPRVDAEGAAPAEQAAVHVPGPGRAPELLEHLVQLAVGARAVEHLRHADGRVLLLGRGRRDGVQQQLLVVALDSLGPLCFGSGCDGEKALQLATLVGVQLLLELLELEQLLFP